jgi:homocitrate synthase NifV
MMKITHKPYFIDTTLRDGEQAPGLAFSILHKLSFCKLMDETGIPELEVGIPAVGEAEMRDLLIIAAQGFHFKRLAWCRANESDIRAASHSKSNGVHISFPVSPILQKAMNKNEQWVMENLQKIIPVALSEFEYVTVGAQDAGRADEQFMKDFTAEASSLGAKRIRLADTVGILNPFSTSKLVRAVHNAAPNMQIEIHAHNDLGMAVANTLAAYIAGAECLSVTVNGLGERAGNAALEEVTMALKLSLNVDPEIDTTRIKELSQLVSTMSQRLLPVDKPITGDNALRHESGIHVDCLIKNRNTYQLFPASMIGTNESDFVYGMHSGRAAVNYFFAKHNIWLTDAESIDILKALKFKANKLGRALRDNELIMLYKK